MVRIDSGGRNQLMLKLVTWHRIVDVAQKGLRGIVLAIRVRFHNFFPAA